MQDHTTSYVRAEQSYRADKIREDIVGRRQRARLRLRRKARISSEL